MRKHSSLTDRQPAIGSSQSNMRRVAALLLLSSTTSASNIRREQGKSGPSWATHLSGGPQQVKLLTEIIQTSCETNIALPFIKKNILKQEQDECPTDDDGSCFAADFLLQKSCPSCPPTARNGTCPQKDKIGANIAAELITKTIEKQLLNNGQEQEGVDMLKNLVALSCGNFKQSQCSTSYQCMWDVEIKKCVLEPCSFLPDRHSCESSPHECLFFGGGDKSHNPMPARTTGINSGGKELVVGGDSGAGCFASPCRLLRKNNIPANVQDRETQCKAIQFTDHSRDFSCLFRKSTATGESAYKATDVDAQGCLYKYMNGNKALPNFAPNFKKECFKERPYRVARRFNKGKCTTPGACNYCGAGMCCKKGDTKKGCSGDIGGAKKFECVQGSGRATKFVY